MRLDEKCNKMEGLNNRTSKYLRSLGAGIASDWLHLMLVIGIVLNLILMAVLVGLSWKELMVKFKKI